MGFIFAFGNATKGYRGSSPPYVSVSHILKEIGKRVLSNRKAIPLYTTVGFYVISMLSP